MYRFILILAFSFSILTTGTNLASAITDDEEKETEELKEIKVTSSRDTFTAENFPGSLTVITEEEIIKKQHQTVADLLRGELGMDVVRSGSFGAQTSIFMRGQGSSSTLVFIDGVPVNANTTGAFDFGDLTLDNIERIEILRGPQSIQWGANAIGGVINIISKKGKGKPTHTLSFEGGSFETFKQSLRSSGAIDKMDYSVSASLLQSEGISALNQLSGGNEKDGYINKTFSTRMGYNFTPDTRLGLNWRYTKSNDEFDNVGGQVSTTSTDNEQTNNIDDYYLSTPFNTNFGGWWDLKFIPSLFYQEAFTIATAGHSTITNRTYTMDLQNNMEVNRFFSVLWGGEYEHQEGGKTGNTAFTKRIIDNQAMFLQGIFEFQNSLVFTGGFRQDFNSEFDEATTYKFEAGYRIAKTGTRLHTGYSKGFRAPTLNDLFTNGAFSNPTLQPEIAKSFEIGVKQDLMGKRIKLALTFFNAVTENFIQSNATFVPQNFGKFRSKGIETAIDITFPYNFSLSMRHTWNDHYLDETSKTGHNKPATRRAKHKFNANLYHNWNNKLDTVVGLYVRSKARGFDSKNTAEAFTTVRAALGYQYNKNLKLTLRGENLFNEDYFEVGGFSTQGVSGYGGFVYTFD